MWERLPEFVGNHPVLTLVFIGLVLALLFTEISRRAQGFATVSPRQLTLLINHNDAVVLDVSPANDFERAHIINARHFNASQIDPDSKEIGKLKDQTLALYCKNGTVSRQVCQKLTKAGFAQVHWLQGGLQAWINEQLPTTSGK